MTPWRRYESQIKAVDIQEGAAVEGSCWFMFTGCDIASADLTKLDTSKVTSMRSMFQECTSLTSLNLKGLDTSSVTNMDAMFYGCTGLTSLDLSGLDTSNVANMDSMFEGCSSLESINLSGWDTSKVTSSANAFKGCSALKSVTVGGSFSATTPFPQVSDYDVWYSTDADEWFSTEEIRADHWALPTPIRSRARSLPAKAGT